MFAEHLPETQHQNGYGDAVSDRLLQLGHDQPQTTLALSQTEPQFLFYTDP